MLTFQGGLIKRIQVQGQDVYIRQLTELEVQKYQASTEAEDGTSLPNKVRESRVHLIVLAVVHPDGRRMFGAEHAPEIAQWPFRITRKLFNEISDWVGLTESEATDVGEIEKNSAATPGGASP